MSVVRYEAERDGRSWVTLMSPAIELAKAIAGTDFVPGNYRGKPAEVAAAIMYGDEVGLGPLQSLAKIAVINGKPTLAAEAQRALIQAAGHEIWVEEATATRVTVGGRRKDSDRSQLFTWTLDDARRAGLAGKQPWRMYPRQMLLARASAELARAVFADVIGGLGATEELEDANAPDIAPEAAQPAPAGGTTRRRRPSRPVIAPAPPEPAPDPPDRPPLPDEEEQPTITGAQSRKLFALFRERGIEDRQERLAWTNRHLDRTVTSSSELTDIEASELIAMLEAEEELAPAGPPPAETITRDRAEILRHMQREAGWDPDPMSELMKLDVEQASELQARINAALDQQQIGDE